jgi:hypothetical protein
MTSSAGSGEAGARRLILKELNKQHTAVRESLRNTGLQFVKAEKTFTVSGWLISPF